MSEHTFRALMLWAVGAIGLRVYSQDHREGALIQWIACLFAIAFLGLMVIGAVEQWA